MSTILGINRDDVHPDKQADKWDMTESIVRVGFTQLCSVLNKQSFNSCMAFLAINTLLLSLLCK